LDRPSMDEIKSTGPPSYSLDSGIEVVGYLWDSRLEVQRIASMRPSFFF